MGALTSLEAIAEKLEERKKLKLEDILRVSGSAAITKNEYGVTVVDDNIAASSLIFKPLTKSKYDNTELVKAINVNVKELKPNIPVLKKDLVPKPLYDEQVTINADLTNQIEGLNLQIDTLNSTINELQSQVETETNNRLNIEQTNDALSNQLNTLTKTIEDFTKQIQSAIQKSVDESILRASLQAQNVGYKAQVEALIKQIDSLNSIIEGLQAQLGAVQQQQTIQNATQNIALAAGGDVLNDVVVLKFTANSTEKGDNALKIQGAINNKSNDSRWELGETLEITNNDTQPVTITLSISNPAGQNWLTYGASGGNKTVTVAAGQSTSIQFGLNVGGCSYGKRDHSTNYIGTINISAKRYNAVEKSIKYRTNINIQHPKNY
jgi:prefoldin subunit 5